jgi:hypothetical protein
MPALTCIDDGRMSAEDEARRSRLRAMVTKIENQVVALRRELAAIERRDAESAQATILMIADSHNLVAASRALLARSNGRGHGGAPCSEVATSDTASLP